MKVDLCYDGDHIICILFHVIPYEYRIVTINQLSFDNLSSSASSRPTILTIDNSQVTTDNVAIGMHPSLMGSFNILAPMLAINTTPSGVTSPLSLLQFCTTYLDDPWNLPSLSTSDEETIPTRVEMSLCTAEAAYQATLDLTMDLGPSPS